MTTNADGVWTLICKCSLVVIFAMAPFGEVLADNVEKIYMAGDMGTASYSNMTKFPSPRGFRISAGRHFLPNVSGEASFIRFADSNSISPGSGGTKQLSASALQVSAIGILPLDEKVELFAKIGLTFNRASGSNSDGISADKSKADLLYGVGQLYHFTSQVAIRLQYEDFGAFESGPNPMKATLLSIGVVYDL
jgi:hypothetical protein